MPPKLSSDAEIAAALRDLPGWSAEGGALVRTVEAPDFMTGIRLVDRVAEVAEEVDHHPDIDIRWRRVTFRLSTHVSHGVTAHDLDLAGRISTVVDEVVRPE